MFIVAFVSGPWQTNCYVVAPDRPVADQILRPAVVIDPGVAAAPQVREVLAANQLELAGIVCTHGHLDHVADAAQLANAHRVPVWLHPADLAMLTEPALGFGPGSELLVAQVMGTTTLPAPADLRELSDAQLLSVAGIDLEVIHAPGHTPGCVVLLGADAVGKPLLFSGDVLFAGSIGRVDLPGGDLAQMNDSLRRLRGRIDAATDILPGHGPSTTMAQELRANPYLSKEALA